MDARPGPATNSMQRLPRRITYAVCFAIGGATRPLLLAAEVPFWPLLVAMGVAGMPLGGLLAGGLAEVIGLTATLLAVGTIYLAACLAPFFGKVWRGLDATPSPELAAERT